MDHVGWNTTASGAEAAGAFTFLNAAYLMPESRLRYFCLQAWAAHAAARAVFDECVALV